MDAKQNPNMKKDMEGLWDCNIICRLFNKTYMTVYNWRKTRDMPHIIIPGNKNTIRFVPNDVLIWAAKNNVELDKNYLKTLNVPK